MSIITPKLTELEFKQEFHRRVKELKEWGISQGYEIGAFLHIDITGIQTDIAYLKK